MWEARLFYNKTISKAIYDSFLKITYKKDNLSLMHKQMQKKELLSQGEGAFQIL